MTDELCAQACELVADGLQADWGGPVRLYLVDIDGKALAVALYGYQDWTPEVRAKVDDILGSMEIT
jgi:hypothetical protein